MGPGNEVMRVQPPPPSSQALFRNKVIEMGQGWSWRSTEQAPEGVRDPPTAREYEASKSPIFETTREIKDSNVYHSDGPQSVINITTNNYHPPQPVPTSSNHGAPVSDAELLKWLTSKATINFRAMHNDIKKKRCKGTGRWLLDMRLYKEWKSTPAAILWGMGIPGAGKTVLASHVIDDLLKLEDDDTCVLFVYCRYTEALTISDILKTLVKECLKRHPGAAEDILPFYEQHKRDETEPTLDDLVDLLKQLERRFKCVFYIIDGVDEALVDVRFDLIKVMNELHGNIILTSRPLDDLGRKLKHSVLFTIEAQEEDVRLLVDDRLERNDGLSELLADNNEKEAVVRKITTKAGGMILHAVLQVEALRECTSIATLYDRLAQFPSGMEGMYAATIERVEAQPPETRDLAMRTLLWIVFAKEPLSLKQIQWALAVHPETYKYDERRVPHQKTILSACCGLVDLHPETNVLRLVHFTAKDALPSLILQRIPQPHAVIARTLIERFVSCNWGTQSTLTPGDYDQRLFQHTLLRYAIKYWGTHTREGIADEGLFHATVEFLRNCNSFPIRLAIPRRPWEFRFDIVGPLHLVSFFDLPIDILGALCSFCDIRSPTSMYKLTPLAFAVDYDRLDIVKRLLHLDGTLVNAKDRDGRTPVHIAVPNDNEPMLSLLLECPEIDVNAVDDDGYTPLHRASDAGAASAVRCLLQRRDVDLTLETKLEGQTALMLACSATRSEVVSLLLEPRDGEVKALNQRDLKGCTALISVFSRPFLWLFTKEHTLERILTRPSTSGLAETVGMLLSSPGIDTTLTDDYGDTALLEAIAQGPESGALALIKHGGNQINIPDKGGRTPLMYAVQKRKEKVVRELLQCDGIEVNARDHQGNTALLLAAKDRYANRSTVDERLDNIITALLQHPAVDLKVKDGTGVPASFYLEETGLLRDAGDS
ncbi:2-5A-dependent ribonuclease [Coprinopsis cinerea okayama7|uniref:2-5A-dependent ribonuclease n=1 Tax=Coprinopsis cinerea (strain Okayama-7 / 130 / ATCC MYA-4618 / FGSC 9003) TaxID=240176 RepID=A8N8A9_COPC7|nr:2-5A-dependent ribonuclease [Coprinopsis cinerea okayama7\|eukprot:XP_001831065.2 2-5A-dependent ribonuclease [Coprinopsis cinerea okayama7\